MKHEMKLNNGPFERIKNGTKTIELRLNDEKRQLLKIKDLIEFTNRTNNEKMLVEIENLYHYPSFEELYKNFDKVAMGYDEDDIADPKDMEEYYSPEDIRSTDSRTTSNAGRYAFSRSYRMCHGEHCRILDSGMERTIRFNGT